MIIIWENVCNRATSNPLSDPDLLLSAFPIKNVFDPHDGYGCIAAEFTPDSKYLITLGAEPEQKMCVWDWTSESSKPKYQIVVGENHTRLKINPLDGTEIMIMSEDSVLFFTLDSQGFTKHAPTIGKKLF